MVMGRLQMGQIQVVLGGPGFGCMSPDLASRATVHAREHRGQLTQKTG